VRQSFLFGRGFGTFIPSEFTPPYQPVASLDNQYLGSLIETGIVGLACLILLLLVWLFTALGARRRSRDPATRELALGLAGSSLALAFGLYVFDAFSFATVSGLMFVLLGMTGALWRLAQQESDVLEVAGSRSPVRHGS
jgi:O-antigen ligase